MNGLQRYICARCGGDMIPVSIQGMGYILRCKGCNHTQHELPNDVDVVDHRMDGQDPDMCVEKN